MYKHRQHASEKKKFSSAPKKKKEEELDNTWNLNRLCQWNHYFGYSWFFPQRYQGRMNAIQNSTQPLLQLCAKYVKGREIHSSSIIGVFPLILVMFENGR
jgi:hypothetical protein